VKPLAKPNRDERSERVLWRYRDPWRHWESIGQLRDIALLKAEGPVPPAGEDVLAKIVVVRAKDMLMTLTETDHLEGDLVDRANDSLVYFRSLRNSRELAPTPAYQLHTRVGARSPGSYVELFIDGVCRSVNANVEVQLRTFADDGECW